MDGNGKKDLVALNDVNLSIEVTLDNLNTYLLTFEK